MTPNEPSLDAADTVAPGPLAPASRPPDVATTRPDGDAPRTEWARAFIDATARHPRLLLGVALVLAVLGRVVLVIRTHAMIDGDEALVGIQAERILRGGHPVYFYGQPYMGSLEAYLAAAVFRVVGPSGWALRAVPIALSQLLVYLTWRLALALLPRASRTTPLLAGLAALVAAVPPLYDAVTELRTWGGQIEVYVITVALLLAAVELADRLRAGASSPLGLAGRWFVLGVLAGLGIWINPLVSYALIACALWLLPPLVARAWPSLWARLSRQPAETAAGTAHTRRASTGAVLAAVVALVPGLALGGLPAWIYAVRHNAENLLVYVTQPTVSPSVSGAARHGRLVLGAAITARYATCVAPRALDGGLPAEPLALLPVRLLLLLVPLAAVVCASWVSLWRPEVAPLRSGLPLLYAVVVTAVFCLGTSAWPATKACSRDEAGRYAVPLVLVEPLLLLALFAAPRLWSALRVRFGQSSPLTSRELARGWVTVLLVLLVAGVTQAATYVTASPMATFQSPFYRRVPLDDTQLLTYLRAHDISAAWANHWLGNIVTFQTDGQTICADYYDHVVRGGIERPPGSIETVSAAPAASFILISTDPHPALARDLERQGIAYTLAVLPQAGVTVITPARTVDPATVANDLGVDYAY